MRSKTSQRPLDILIVSQLAAIKKQELGLRKRLRSIGASDSEASTLRSAVAALQASADRLNRMVDAMSPLGSFSVA